MIIVAGHLTVDPNERDAYLVSCEDVVQKARRTAGCLDFAISADLAVPGRINVFERWESRAAVEAFRGDGPSADQRSKIRAASVSEYRVDSERSLTGNDEK
jgi:quinol monooxygenase YgiN